MFMQDDYVPAVIQFLQTQASLGLAPGSPQHAAVDALAAVANEEHLSLNPQHGHNPVDIVNRTEVNKALFLKAQASGTAVDIRNFALDVHDLGDFW
jgi:hypothetical protein